MNEVLKRKIINRESGILLYGITPPKENNTDERIIEISQKHVTRIKEMDIDGLVLYDIQDESDRTQEARTFEFIKTVDPSVYSRVYMKDIKVPRIIYRCAGNYTKTSFSTWLLDAKGKDEFTVFVGTASAEQDVQLKLQEAYDLRTALNEGMLLGGVTIPERHMKLHDEPERVGFKMSKGCRFFVSQAVYDLENSKKFLRDYAHYCQTNNIEPAPIIFTLTPCGSEKTLAFIKWLGIHIPTWLEDKLLGADEMLSQSVEISFKIFKELLKYGQELQVPVGCNVESVSIRKVEIDASVTLTREISEYLKGKGLRI
jgi:hypothetical protein